MAALIGSIYVPAAGCNGSSGGRLTFLNPMIGYSAWFGSLPEDHARAVVARLAAATFLADWSQRNIPLEDPRYTEGSYQFGSAWPFLTAGPLLAHYRYHAVGVRAPANRRVPSSPVTVTIESNEFAVAGLATR